MERTTQSTPFSEQGSTRTELSQQAVALRDLDLARWRPAESYGTSTSNDTMREDLISTSLEDSGMGSPGAFSDEHGSDSASSLAEEDAEPDLETPLEYARFHGLCRDCEADHPLSREGIPFPPADLCSVADEPEGVLFPDALIAEVHDSLNERLDVDKEAANFLMSILRTCKQNEGDRLRVDLAEWNPKRLKLELPVLASDHEVDMITVRRRNEVKLTSRGIEPFQRDKEKGESFAFSSSEINDKHRLDGELQNEKLDVGKETVELFRQLRDLTSSKEVDHANEAYISYKVSTTFQ